MEKIAPLAKAGASFEFVFARRTPEQPGRGILYVTPVKGAKVIQAAKAAGFDKAPAMHPVRIEGGDKPGIGASMLRTLAHAGISFRGISAHAIGRKFTCTLALDSAQDADRAVKLLKKL